MLGSFALPVFLSWGHSEALQIPVIIGAVFWALLIWLMLRTKYVVSDDVLTIHGGIYKVKIPLKDIISVESCSSLEAGPALSLDRLQIIYGNYKNILVSPKDKTGFLAAIGKP